MATYSILPNSVSDSNIYVSGSSVSWNNTYSHTTNLNYPHVEMPSLMIDGNITYKGKTYVYAELCECCNEYATKFEHVNNIVFCKDCINNRAEDVAVKVLEK